MNRLVRDKVVPQLVRAREGYELDSPSANEPGYSGENRDAIKLLDQERNYLARSNNTPTGYRPPSSFLTPSDHSAFERNQKQIERETLPQPPRVKAATAEKQANYYKCVADALKSWQPDSPYCVTACKPNSWGGPQACKQCKERPDKSYCSGWLK